MAPSPTPAESGQEEVPLSGGARWGAASAARCPSRPGQPLLSRLSLWAQAGHEGQLSTGGLSR